MDFAAIRSRLAGAEGRLYWRSLGELADSQEFRDYLHREFPEQASEWNDPKGRRQFLKLMSASLALAGVGACTKQPPESIVPYVRQPEDLVPGRPLFYASAIPMDGIAAPVLVESHMGRPTKIEGNPDHPASLGATDIFTQAAILNLYDPDRAQTTTYRGEVRGWGAFLSSIQSALTAQKARGGAGLRFLTGPVTSPTLSELMATILRDYPQARWHRFDPVTRVAAPAATGQAAAAAAQHQHPIYRFDQADVIVTLDADFLSCGPASVRYSRDFAARRRVEHGTTAMSRMYAIESTPSLTGAKADHRLAVRASEVEGVASLLASAVGAGGAANSQAPTANSQTTPSANSQSPTANVQNPDVAKYVAAIAKDLQAHRGKSVVVAGDYQPASVHAIARAMNEALGNAGTTVIYGAPIEPVTPNTDTTIVDLARAMDAGQVELLVILGGNPVFTAPADLRFAERMTKVGLIVYHSLYTDETSNLSHWNIAAAHELESWGDARAYDGTVTLMQPLIEPLYSGVRSAYELLGTFTPQPDRRGLDIVRDYWTRAYKGQGGWKIVNAEGQPFSTPEAFWRQAVHDGFIAGTAVTQGGPATPFAPMPRATVTPAAQQGAPLPSGAAAAAAVGAGTAPQQAGAATQQTPVAPADPRVQPSAAIPQTQIPGPPNATVPGATAGNQGQATSPQPQAPSPQPPAASTGPAQQGGLEIIFRPDPTIWDGRFANNGWLQELPKPFTKLTWDPTAWVAPRLAEERGLRNGDVVELRYRGATARLPVFIVPGHPAQSVTVHFGYGRQRAGRVGNAVANAEQFNTFVLRTSDAPWFGNGLEIAKTGENYPLATTQQHHMMEGRAPVRTATFEEYTAKPAIIHEQGHTPPRTLTLYPEHEYNGYKWGMAIDLSTCTGCSTCTIACQAENNIPVVGKEQVLRSREMHWIRVDHYWAGEDLEHAESYNMPVPCMQCENAPCEVVCPVAATSHSSEGLNDMTYNRCVGTRYCSNNCPYKVRRFNFLLYSDWDTQSLEGVRNPDVTVRSRGVMEKCTYCVQRINQARIDAKREERQIRDGEVIPACASACPADAIVFGDMNDPQSRVNKLKAEERNYGVLEDLNTRPRTTYLAEIRNPNPELPAIAGRPTEH